MDFSKIHCKDILYRSGFVEVSPGIHDNHINLEIWNIDPDRSSEIVDEGSLTGDDVTAVVELELNIPQTRELIRQLQLALSKLEAKYMPNNSVNRTSPSLRDASAGYVQR